VNGITVRWIMKNENPLALAGYYFQVQGFAGLAWLFLITFHAETGRLFTPTDFPAAYLSALRLPDLLLFVGGSLATGYCIKKQSAKAAMFSAVTLGAVGYATLLTVSISIHSDSGLLGSLLMGASLLGTSFATLKVVKK
jgi:hypothetical protein